MPGKREKEEIMECKKCGQLLEEGQTLCPSCGEDNEIKKPKKKMQKKENLLCANGRNSLAKYPEKQKNSLRCLK